MSYGRIESVADDVHGSDLAGDHPAGSTVLTLDDTFDFGDPEVQTVQALHVPSGTVLTVAALDDDAGTLTLSAATTAAYADGDRIEVYPRVVERKAEIREDDAEEEGEAMECVVPHTLWDRIPVGVRAQGEGEAVEIDDSGDTWYIFDVLGAAPVSRAREMEIDYSDDSPGIRLYDENGNPVVILDAKAEDGLSHLLVGTYKNALGDPRWEISSSFLNEIRGYAVGTIAPASLMANDRNLQMISAHPDASWDRARLRLLSGSPGSTFEIHASEIELASPRQARGYCAVRQAAPSVTGSGNIYGNGVTYGGVSRMANVPTGITFTTVGTDSNVASVDAADITNRGFTFRASSAASGFMKAARTYVTTGA